MQNPKGSAELLEPSPAFQTLHIPFPGTPLFLRVAGLQNKNAPENV